MDSISQICDASVDETLADLEQKIPRSPDDEQVRKDASEKVARLRRWLEENRFDSALITRRDNFAWLTVGGSSHVLRNTEFGAGNLLITPDHQYVLGYSMDVDRILEEEVPGQGYAVRSIHWYQGDPRMQALKLGGKRIAADTALPGMEDCATLISRMHGGLTELELNRLRWLAHKSALLLEAIAQWLRPGMTEREVGQMLLAVYALNGIELDVIIVGSDERLAKFSHAVPSDKQIERCVMFHPAARRWGLHANVNRFVSFGKPDLRFEKAHAAATTIEAHVLGEVKAGNRFADILNKQKQWYAQYGYPDEWKLHFQGGTTGYPVGDASLCLTDARIEINTAFDWFITINGIQVEELSLLTPQGIEVSSMGKKWPTISIETSGGSITIPIMWALE